MVRSSCRKVTGWGTGAARVGWHVQFSQEWGVTNGTPVTSMFCNILKNHLKRGMMKSEVNNSYIGAFYTKNPILCSLVLQGGSLRLMRRGRPCQDHEVTNSPDCPLTIQAQEIAGIPQAGPGWVQQCPYGIPWSRTCPPGCSLKWALATAAVPSAPALAQRLSLQPSWNCSKVCRLSTAAQICLWKHLPEYAMEVDGWKGILWVTEKHSWEEKMLLKLIEPSKGDFSSAQAIDYSCPSLCRAHTSEEHRPSTVKLATARRCSCSPVNPTHHPVLPKHRPKAHWIPRNHAAEWGHACVRQQALLEAMVPAHPHQKTNWSMSWFLLH